MYNAALGGLMRKLFFILIAFIAVVTFIRAFDYSVNINPENPPPISETKPEVFIN